LLLAARTERVCDSSRITYLAQCPGSSCTGVNAASLEWFKIDQVGLISGTIAAGSWGAGKMIAQNSSWTSTIPASVPSGAYLIRFETIALHSLPAQFYPECAQINIVNGGSLAPTSSQLCKFPGCYSDSDPGRACFRTHHCCQTCLLTIMHSHGQPLRQQCGVPDHLPDPRPAPIRQLDRRRLAGAILDKVERYAHCHSDEEHLNRHRPH
jgi:hypothetical protein